MRRIALVLLGFFSWTSFAYTVVPAEAPYLGSRLYIPNDGLKHPSIVMLHGSEGGSEPFIDGEANLLAAQGFAVMVYCYFDCKRGPTQPKATLKDVEATGVLDAVAWMRSQARSNGKVFVYGYSRGAEFTMIVGSLPTTPANRPDALVAHAPSDIYNAAFNSNWDADWCWLCRAGYGQCDSSSPSGAYFWNSSCGAGNDPTAMDFNQSSYNVNGVNVKANTRIEIEKYTGPILITVGLEDEVWPVGQTQRIEATLKAAGRPAEVHYFPGEGHNFKIVGEIKRRAVVLAFLQTQTAQPSKRKFPKPYRSRTSRG